MPIRVLRRHRVPVSFCLLALVALAASGCHSPEPAKFNQGLGASEDPTLIVPFSERVKNRLYGESAHGTFVAEALKNWARVEWRVDFDESEAVRRVLDSVRDRETDEELTMPEWQRLTQGLGVRYVVSGDIKKFQLRDPSQIGLIAPSAAVSFRVVDVMNGRTVYATRDKEVRWSADPEKEVPMAFVGQDLQGVERRLLQRIAEEVGKDLYGYTKH